MSEYHSMRYLVALCLIVFASLNVMAQADRCKPGVKAVQILQSSNRKFKIKTVTGVSSATAREADYVEFKTMEKIYSDEPLPQVLFDKDTPIYGLVTLRKSRHFPLKRGKLELILEPLVNWN